MPSPPPLYDTDFHQWAQQQAALLRAGKWHELDHDHLAEEIDDLSRRLRQALRNRLLLLVVHLLKWQYQPERRAHGHSWYYTIREQRLAIAELFADNPSLRPMAAEALTAAYPRARLRAARETHLPEATFPVACPWLVAQVLDDEFWPERV